MKLEIDVSGRVDFHVHGFERLSSRIEELLSTLVSQGAKVMSKITDFVAQQEEYNARLDKSIDGIVGDIRGLHEEITNLQNSSGQLSAEDQAALDRVQARTRALVEKAEALDALTPPKPPVPDSGGTTDNGGVPVIEPV